MCPAGCLVMVCRPQGEDEGGPGKARRKLGSQDLLASFTQVPTPTDLGVQAQGPPGLQKGGELHSSPGQVLLGGTGTPGPSLPDLLRECHPLLRTGRFFDSF